MSELSSGDLIDDKYRLERLLGEGGMGSVWAARHVVTRKTAALKFVKGATESGDVRRRFLREARAACAVRHPNVVEIHDVLELSGGAPVMVMELLEGESLADRLDREPKLPVAEVARIMLPVVSAVGTAHALGIVHRDLKPHNIFLARGFGGAEVVKVLDFGIAKLTAIDGEAAQTTGLTGTGAMLGTPCYMSPEQAFGEKDIDHRSDIWALGVILYECLSGVLPTAASNVGQVLKIVLTGRIRPLSEVDPSLPAEITTLVERMLRHERADRPEDLREVKEVLARHVRVEVQDFGPPTVRARESLDTSRPSNASAETLVSDSGATPPSSEPLSKQVVHAERTADPMAATSAATPDLSTPSAGVPVVTTPAATKRRAPVVAAVAVGIAVVAGAGFMATRTGSRPAVAPSATALADVPGTSTTATGPAVVPTATASAAAPPQPSASASDAAALPSASAPIRAKPRTAKPAATDKPAAPAPEQPRSPSGLVEKPPF